MYKLRQNAPNEATKKLDTLPRNASRPNGNGQEPLQTKRSEDREPDETRSLMDALESSFHLTLFAEAVKQAHLEDRLRHFSGPYTVLAPTDAALRALPRLPDDPAALAPLVNRHIVFGRLEAKDFWRRSRLAPLGGPSIRIERKARRIEDAHLLIQNLMADNGIVHGISCVLTHEATGHQEDMGKLTLLKSAFLHPLKAMLR